MIQRRAARARYFLRFCRLTLEGVEIGPRHKLNNRAIKMVITAKVVKTLAHEPVKLRCSIAWNVASPTSTKARQITKRYRYLPTQDGIRGRRPSMFRATPGIKVSNSGRRIVAWDMEGL